MLQPVVEKDKQAEILQSILNILKEIGYAGIAGQYKKAKTKEDAELLLAIETILSKAEQKKIIESDFTV